MRDEDSLENLLAEPENSLYVTIVNWSLTQHEPSYSQAVAASALFIETCTVYTKNDCFASKEMTVYLESLHPHSRDVAVEAQDCSAIRTNSLEAGNLQQ